ncbi:MAG: hypothetical protein IJF65_03990 [Clostridia bacterium]|nr:hypothetical protein [Clostridia bacterium]
MKKVVALLMALSMLFGFAMAQNAELVGLWEISHAEYQGTTLGAEALGNEWIIELKDDATVAITMDGDTAVGTWRVENGQLVLNNGESDMAFTLTDKGFCLTEGEASIHFGKQDAATASAASNSLSGAWTLTTVERDGISVDASVAGAEIVFHLYEDGTLTAVINGSSETGTWEEKEGVLYINDGTQTMACTLDGATFFMEQDGMKMNFARMGTATKVAVTGFDTTQITSGDAPAQIEAQALTDFNGSWGNAYMVQNGMRVPLSMANMSSSLQISDGRVEIEINGMVSTIPMMLANGTLTITAGETTLTIALCEGNQASLTTNGQTFYYGKMN